MRQNSFYLLVASILSIFLFHKFAGGFIIPTNHLKPYDDFDDCKEISRKIASDSDARFYIRVRYDNGTLAYYRKPLSPRESEYEKLVFDNYHLRECDNPRLLAVYENSMYGSCSNSSRTRGFRMIKNSSIVDYFSSDGQGKIEDLVVDGYTYNVYVIQDSKIRICDEKLAFCRDLQTPNALYSKPSKLALDTRDGALYFINQNQKSNHSIMNVTIVRVNRDGQELKEIVTYEKLDQPVDLAVATSATGVHWIVRYGRSEQWHLLSRIEASVTLKGSPMNTTYPRNSMAVYSHSTYYLEKRENGSFIVEWNNYFREYSDMQWKHGDTKNPLMLDFVLEQGSLRYDKLRFCSFQLYHNPCRYSCSHLCTFTHENTVKPNPICYCDDRFAADSNGFCKETTLLATYENNLLIIGLSTKNSKMALDSSFVRKIKFSKDINAVAAITYASRQGGVIVTDTGKQRIYFWNSTIGQPKLLLDDGPGTILSIEFDPDKSGSIYWINPTDNILKRMNLLSGNVTTFFEGSSSKLITFTLMPEIRYMYILYRDSYSNIKLKRISMDPSPISIDTVLSQSENVHSASSDELILHYQRRTRKLYLLNKKHNQIKLWNETTSKFENLANERNGTITSITSMNEEIFWSDNNLQIYGTNSLPINLAESLGVVSSMPVSLKLAGVSEMRM